MGREITSKSEHERKKVAGRQEKEGHWFVAEKKAITSKPNSISMNIQSMFRNCIIMRSVCWWTVCHTTCVLCLCICMQMDQHEYYELKHAETDV